MVEQLKASIVRIFLKSDENIPVGVGFLVTNKQVLTCAHVIAQALSLIDVSTMPQEYIRLDFPLVATGRILNARVVCWQLNDEEDIAILEVEMLLPDIIRPVHLVTSQDLWGHSFRAFGFPLGYDKGVWASGVLRDKHAGGWVQIEAIHIPGHRVVQGFSGTPVWDEQLNGVCGMVIESDRQESIKTAYIIPTNLLIEAWPLLKQGVISPCPYRGLSVFREIDEPYFLGRGTFTDQLVKAIQKKPLVAVIGPSGSGKSSVVFAGLLPRLRQAGEWLIAACRPGKRPFHSLAASLVHLLEPHKSEADRLVEVNKLAEYLKQGVILLQDVAASLIEKNQGMRLLLIIDQCEELYTLCHEVEIRQHFLDDLLAEVQSVHQHESPIFNVILTLRADFVGAALSYRPFADALQYADLKLGPMNRQELQDVIKKPAQRVGVHIENGLTERILDDLNQEVGSLPLLEFALTLLWTKQHMGMLTHTAYEEIGGVKQALTDHAERVYSELNENEKRRLQQIFIQLVRIGEGTENTRRLATRTDIGEDNWGLVVRLSSARLVVSTLNEATGEETAEIVHEALIEGWRRLHEWMESNHEFRIWQERLRIALQQWQSSAKDSGALLHGALLAEAIWWLERYQGDISRQEQAFIEMSQRYQAEEELRWKALYEEANQQRLIAEQQQRIAIARGLAAQSELLGNQRADLVECRVLLAVEAMLRCSCLEADRAVRNGLSQLRRRLVSLSVGAIVTAVAFSPDGKLLFSTSEDHTAGIWEIDSGRRLATITFRKVFDDGALTATVFSSDRKLLATANDNQGAEVWDIATGRHLASLHHGGDVSAVTFSPDGKLLATSGWNGITCIWEIASGRCLVPLSHKGAIRTVVFSPEGILLSTTSDDDTACLWDVASGRCLASLTHKKGVRAVAFSPDGKLFATASSDNTAYLWDVVSHRRLASLTHNGDVYAVAFSPNGKLLATASSDNTAGIWDIADHRRLASLPHKGNVRDVVFSPGGTLLITTSDDQTAGVWDTASGLHLTSLPHKAMVSAVAFSSDGNLLATADADGTAEVWKIAGDRYLNPICYNERVRKVAFSSDGKLLATANDDGMTEIWRVADGQNLVALTHKGAIRAMTFSPDGGKLITVSAHDAVNTWNIARGQCIATLTPIPDSEGIVHEVICSPDGSLLIRENFSSIEIWQVSSGNCKAILSYQKNISHIACSSDGNSLAFAINDHIEVWDIANSRCLTSLVCDNYIYSVVFSLDGKLLAAGKGNVVEVWDIASSRCLTSFPHNDAVFAIAFSPDGRLLATGCRDGIVNVWNIADGHLLVSLVHSSVVADMVFSPAGHLLATASSKMALIWPLKSEDLIAEAKSRLQRNLTKEEWKQYIKDEPYRKTFPDLP